MSHQRAIAALIFLGTLGFLSGWLWPTPRIGPRLEISPEFDLGELVHDQELTLAIGFRNAGDEPLHVDPPIPGCHCALAKLERDTFAQGETGRFEFTVRPAGPPSGQFQQTVVVPSNDPRAPRRTVFVRGKMQGTLTSEPKALRSGSVPVGEEWNARVVVACSDPKAEFEIHSVRCDLPGCEIDTPVRLANEDHTLGSRYSLELHQARIGRLGRQAGKITVVTGHPRYRELTIPVELDGVSRLKVRPASLLFDSADNRVQTVVMTSPVPVTLAVAERPSAEDPFDVALSSEDDGRRWQIEVKLPNGTHDKLRRGAISLSVAGVEHEDAVQIPYSILPGLLQAQADVHP